MNASWLALLGLAISGVTYIALSWRIHRRTKRLSDHFPLNIEGAEARVASAGEFSAATVATTISLATVILAYTELASYMGTWLFWTVITTGAGIFVARLAARRIWRRLGVTVGYRPTLHDFLGSSFGSESLARAAALCTSLGFIGAFAVELTVGATFLKALVPSLPAVVALLLLATIGVGYTVLGGFRAVIITDQIQMRAIWVSIAALAVAVFLAAESSGGIGTALARLPAPMYDFSKREGLLSFLIGIFIINVPTYVADMSIWQRIGGAQDETTVTKGLTSSVIAAVISWSAFAALACALVAVVTVVPNENPLLTFLRTVGNSGTPVAASLFVVVITGLYAASLSTASTQLVASGHALHMDVVRGNRDRSTLANSADELGLARWLLLGVSAVSVGIVWALQSAGFSIADLVFAVYGAQLGLVPAVAIALMLPKERLQRLGRFAAVAILAGFFAGWASAVYGKWVVDSNLVFLAPAASLFVSTIILTVGFLVHRTAGPSAAQAA